MPKDKIDSLFADEEAPLPKSDLLTEALALCYRSERIVCPVCCRNYVTHRTSARSISKGKEGRIHFNQADLEGTRHFLQVAYAIPRKGFHINPDESLNFKELVAHPDYTEFIDEMYETSKRIISVIDSVRKNING